MKKLINFKVIIGMFFVMSIVFLVSAGSVLASVDCQSLGGISCQSLDDVLYNVIKTISILLAGIFVLVMIVGGIMIMTIPSTEKQQKGKNTIKWAIIGAVISLLSYSIFAILQATLT